MDAGPLVLGLIIVLAIAGMSCIIISFFVDKPKYIPPKKIHPMHRRTVLQDDAVTVILREWDD